MINLFETDIRDDNRKSSKGNQLKWNSLNKWYKADYTGYEGLSEYMVSHLLKYSDMNSDEYVLYDTEEIMYKNTRYLGCKSNNFLESGSRLITLERLFNERYGESLYRSIYAISGIKDRIRFVVEQTERITGMNDFGKYLCMLLTIDALFLNEDRHTHNIAVIRDEYGRFHYCPVFDNGAALLSDIRMDYPLNSDIYELIDSVQSKTVCSDFTEQLEATEELYGQTVRFSFGHKEIDRLLAAEPYYSDEIKNRISCVLSEQRRRLSYLFT